MELRLPTVGSRSPSIGVMAARSTPPLVSGRIWSATQELTIRRGLAGSIRQPLPTLDLTTGVITAATEGTFDVHLSSLQIGLCGRYLGSDLPCPQTPRWNFAGRLSTYSTIQTSTHLRIQPTVPPRVRSPP